MFDLTHYSFEEFISFFFAREVAPNAENAGKSTDKPWYWRIEDTFLPETICAYYIQLFRKPEFLIHQFSKPQLEQGFWAMQGVNLNCGLPNLLGNTDLAFDAREDCIRAMEDLFRRLFAKEPLDTSVHMWWDSLCYDWQVM